ncbi:hypothetical protein EML15_07940 [Corynebacterium sp. sy017]|uniref:hypothetical protein n=1 Tax=unclassified Corynebacterium TaxID=2624378 RepID=UPI001185587B|nr:MULTISPECIES: hypothetical protein [unclassified Corynebacterium]MBP3089073.1 hypothetical protein [Corynebacterium sp. sy017]TSD91388.1 hypothetical protein ELY17_07950 [Corynebacterium sp. SY003]
MMRFYWLEIKKAKPRWAYVCAAIVLGMVAAFTSVVFVHMNGDVIAPEQIAKSMWSSAGTQLYALVLGPVVVSILAGSLARAEVSDGVIELIRSRVGYTSRKIPAVIVALGVLGLVLSSGLVFGWCCAGIMSGVSLTQGFVSVGVLALRNVVGVIAWGLISFAIFVRVRDFGVGFALCLGLAMFGSVVLVKSAIVAMYNPLAPMPVAVGYPFPGYSVVTWIVLAVSLVFGFYCATYAWKRKMIEHG